RIARRCTAERGHGPRRRRTRDLCPAPEGVAGPGPAGAPHLEAASQRRVDGDGRPLRHTARVFSYGPLAVNRAASFRVAVEYVVCQHSVVPSPIMSWTITGSVRPSAGVGKFGPRPFACTFASPAAPALSFTVVMPVRVPALLIL